MSESTPKQLVFVLGAGASVDLDLPMGSELTGKIRSALSFKSDGFNVSGGDDILRQAFANSRSEYPTWYDASKLIASAMPLAPSIDNFVDVHRHDKGIAYCAKAAITRCILKAEKASTIYVDPSNIYNTIDFHKNINAWHTKFFRTLTMYCTAQDLGDRLKSIGIISFNYDRCFEHFLFHAIRTYYKISHNDAAEILSNLEIYHPYGKVGTLPNFGSGLTIGYGEDIGSRDLIEISKQIRTFTESTSHDSSELTRIREIAFESRLLVFLGFAFHPLNVNLLFPHVPAGPKNYKKKVLGTALGSSQGDLQIISSDLASRHGSDVNLMELRKELKCDQLFNEYSRTLSLT